MGLTGRRSEATFLMFKSFLPKMVAIPAAVLPIAFLPFVAYDQKKAAIGEDQPASAVVYLKLLSGPISTIFCVASFVVKLRFPLRTESQVNAIGLGVALHGTGKDAPDPLSRCDPPQLYGLVKLTNAKEHHLANIVNHFPGVTVLRKMLGLELGLGQNVPFAETRRAEVFALQKTVNRQVVCGFVVMCFFGFLAFFCALGPPKLLESDALGWICTVLMIIFGPSLVFTVGAALRRGAVTKLAKEYSEI